MNDLEWLDEYKNYYYKHNGRVIEYFCEQMASIDSRPASEIIKEMRDYQKESKL